MKTEIGVKCGCGCNKYWEDCRTGIGDDGLAQFLYCSLNLGVAAFEHCDDCSLVNYGLDCKNNEVKNQEVGR